MDVRDGILPREVQRERALRGQSKAGLLLSSTPCITDLLDGLDRDLEQAVEELSELLESPIDAEAISALRQKVTDKTVGIVIFCDLWPVSLIRVM